MGFLMEGMEQYILKFFQNLCNRRERSHNKEVMERSCFDRELRRLEFSINYDKEKCLGGIIRSSGGEKLGVNEFENLKLEY